MSVVVGVDPGGHSTGIVVRAGGTLVAWWLVESETFDDDYRRAVRAAVDEAWAACRGSSPRSVASRERLLALEDVVAPSPWLRGQISLTNVTGLLKTSQVIGWIVADADRVGRRRPLVLVAPGRHGSGPLATYPPDLVGARERAGSGRLRHVRSAWDIAGAARLQAQLTPPVAWVGSVHPMTTTTTDPLAEFGAFYARVVRARDVLTDETRARVRALAAQGFSARDIAKAAGMSRQNVYRLLEPEEPNGNVAGGPDPAGV